MEKQIYLIRGSEEESYDKFTGRILELAGNVAQKIKPEALKLTVTCEAPPKLSVIPFKKKKIAVISVYINEHGIIELPAHAQGFAGGYKVEETLLVEYEKTWPDKEPTPGVCLLTLFHRKPRINPNLFIHRWYNRHTPLSLRLHPLWNYSRNEVKEKLTGQSAWYDGIVEEQFRDPADLLNPARFFGSPLTMLYHMLEVYIDTKSFIDYRKMEIYLASEYHIIS